MKRFGGVSRPLFAFTKPMAVTSALALLAGAQPADAAGFYIKEQSVTGLGRAFAGEFRHVRGCQHDLLQPRRHDPASGAGG